MEPANFIAFNLMHDIVTGKLTSEKAREVYSEVMAAYLMNRPATYEEQFQFNVPSGDTADTDEVTQIR